MRRGVVLGSAAALLVLGGGLLWDARIRSAGDADPAGDERASPRGPGLAAAPRPSPARSAPAQDAPPLAPEMDAALAAVLAITAQSDPTAVQALIAALSRALCVEGGAHRAVLDRALHATDASERAVRAAILALGRCGREEVLRDLVAALRDPATPMRERESIVFALGQPRQAEFVAPDGQPVMSSGDVNLTGPIRERFVLDAMLETLAERADSATSAGPGSEAFRDWRARSGLRLACIQALAGSAGDADDVFDSLNALAEKEPGLRSLIVGSLGAARPGSRMTAQARRIVQDRASSDSDLQAALGLWMMSDLTAAVDFVLSELASSEATEGRKALVLHHAGSFPFSREASPDVDRLIVQVVAWAQAHPKVVTGYGPPDWPNPARTPIELDMLEVAAIHAMNAYRATSQQSPVLRRLAADTLVDRLSRRSTAGEHRRPPRWVDSMLDGDDAFMLLVLEGLRTVQLDDDMLLDVVDVLGTPRPYRPPRSAAIDTAVARVTERLTPVLRERLEARRREAKPR